MSHDFRDNARPAPDPALLEMATYVAETTIESPLAIETARHVLMDSLACALMALEHPACTRLLGPIVPGAELPDGVPVVGTRYRLDPVRAAFDLGALIRWLDFNDTWLAAEWGHPSDNLGGILAVADHVSRARRRAGKAPLTMQHVLQASIKAHELQGVLALENAFNRLGLDHVMLVRIASAAVCTDLLGGGRDAILDALSHAFLDGNALRTYRHAPNTGSRKSWAAGDATARGVMLALLTMRGEMGYPGALSAPRWGFHDVVTFGEPLKIARPFGSYVMENVLFKLAFPAEFHGQTAVEAAFALHPEVLPRIEEIERVAIETQDAGCRIIDKRGPLHNAADRDHCLQYMVAVGLLRGALVASDYDDDAAADPRIDALRARMEVTENRRFSVDYLDPDKRSIANAVQVFFRDGTSTERVEVEYPIGHRRRRDEGLPILLDKLRGALALRYAPDQARVIEDTLLDGEALAALPVDRFLERWIPEPDPAPRLRSPRARAH